MKISYTINTETTMYNRLYAKGKVSSKHFTITATRESKETFSAEELKDTLTAIDKILDGGLVINVQDPYMVHVLEPKSGNTVHNRLNELKRVLTGKEYAIIGNTIPPETLNGYIALVLGADYDVTLEGLAEWILRSYPSLTSIKLDDGKITVELGQDDLVA